MGMSPRLPKEVCEERTQFALDLFRKGKTIGQVNSAVREKFGRSLNWKNYRNLQAQANGLPSLSSESKPKAEPQTDVEFSVQPMRKVTPRLRLRLQSVVNELGKSGVEKVSVDRTGAIRVVFVPEEQIFDLTEEG